MVVILAKKSLETHAVSDEDELLLAICSFILISNVHYLVDTNYHTGLLDSLETVGCPWNSGIVTEQVTF